MHRGMKRQKKKKKKNGCEVFTTQGCCFYWMAGVPIQNGFRVGSMSMNCSLLLYSSACRCFVVYCLSSEWEVIADVSTR